MKGNGKYMFLWVKMGKMSTVKNMDHTVQLLITRSRTLSDSVYGLVKREL